MSTLTLLPFLAITSTRAARFGIVKGFAVGRTIFNAAAEKWLKGEIDDDAAIDDMAQRFAALTEVWRRLRGDRAA